MGLKKEEMGGEEQVDHEHRRKRHPEIFDLLPIYLLPSLTIPLRVPLSHT
jgi:hypothetical protein